VTPEFGRQRLLVLAPHPDDEVLGCGGLIKLVKDAGGHVYVLFMTVGDTREYSEAEQSTSGERMREIERVAKFLRYDDYAIAFPDGDFHLRLDAMPQKDVISKIESGTSVSLDRIRPTIVATPRLSDYHQDHRATSRALFAAARPAPDGVKPLQNIIVGYEPASTADWWDETAAKVNYFVRLSEAELDAKLEALRLYSSQLRHGSHPRSLASIETMARLRGRSAGCDAAEAFVHYRTIL